jgi:cell fate (sporulation/competence/biofilm development) regulator YlbF (YheA/YmcA/DUF963 family)
VIEEKAQELGRLIGQSEDYKALKRARDGLEGVQELDAKFEELQQVAARLEKAMAEGAEPPQADGEAYQRLLGEVQSDSRYQSLVAAQANFDKLMLKVQDQIMEGIKKGSESVIITLD